MNYLVLFGQSETLRYPVIDRWSSNIWESNCCQWTYCLSTSCFLITNWFLFKAVRSVWRGVGRTHTHTHAGCVWLVCVCVCVWAGLVLRSGSRCSSRSFSELRMRRTSVVLWQLLAFSSGTIFDILLTSWSQCEPTRLPPEPEPEPEPAAASYHSFDSFVAV